MFSEIAKNLWLLLTLVIPGLFTYGAWRIILVLKPSRRLADDVLGQTDNSILVTTSIIVAIALLQQAIAIVIEAGLSLLAKIMRNKWPNFYTLLCERFALVAAGKLNESTTRIIGNFFLSMNISVGLGFLLLYFLVYESMAITQWVPISLIVLLVAILITAMFRMLNAKWAIEECKKDHPTEVVA